MPSLITSPHNPTVKRVMKLRERRQREREGLMLVEGHQELSLALDSGVQLRMLLFCRAFFGAADSAGTTQASPLLERARQAGADLLEVSPAVFEKIAFRENPDGWLAVAPVPRRNLADLRLGPRPLVVVVQAVEKPGNLGAILRSADAVGVDGLIVCDPTTDVANPNVVRASKGALFSLPVVQAQSADVLTWLRERGLALVATTPQTDLIYTRADLRGPVAIAVGTEDEGLSPFWLDHADVRVRIPMSGRVNSLNVAAAATLMLYEAMRQRSPS